MCVKILFKKKRKRERERERERERNKFFSTWPIMLRQKIASASVFFFFVFRCVLNHCLPVAEGAVTPDKRKINCFQRSCYTFTRHDQNTDFWGNRFWFIRFFLFFSFDSFPVLFLKSQSLKVALIGPQCYRALGLVNKRSPSYLKSFSITSLFLYEWKTFFREWVLKLLQ